ncbi:MAG: hypothetical protein KDD82_24020 [Planctomycetes bacterium]|nr:hypothetical protein [Planctomycetota bacterium]
MFLRLRPTRPARDRPCRECGAEAEGARLQLTVYEPRPRRTPRRWGSLGHAAACCLEDPAVRLALRARAEDRLAALASEDPPGAESVREELERLLPAVGEAPDALDALGLDDRASVDDVRKAYHAQARSAHPDAGGDPAAFDELHRIYREALAWVTSRGP